MPSRTVSRKELAVPAAFDIHPPASDREKDAYAEILRACFCTPIEHARAGLERTEPDNVLLVCRGSDVLGGLMLLPTGHWLGGRCVPTLGVAAVGIAPEHRGCGAARALMGAALHTAVERSLPLSTLYPATHTLYRRCGYELAGHYFEVTIEPAGIPALARAATMQPIGAADEPGVEALYARAARRHAGWLERSPYFWKRIREPRDATPHARLVTNDGAPVGYCYYLLERKELHFQRMLVLDMLATTPEAASRLLAFLGDHRSLVNEVIWHGPASDPLLMLLPERSYRVRVAVDWMLRVTDVAAALRLRGYPRGVAAEIHFDIRDELFPANVGRWVLSVADGAAEVSCGGEGHVSCDVRALAALYTGYMTPAQLDLTGLLHGRPEHLSAIEAVFAGPPPCMLELF